MKRFVVITICLCLLIPMATFAQEKPIRLHSDLHHEFGVSAGPNSIVGGTVYGTVGVFSALFSGLGNQRTQLRYYGEYGLHYYYQVTHWCQVGVKTTLDVATLTRYSDTMYSTINKIDKYLLLSVMPSVRFTYLNRPWVRLYSGLDVGCGYLFSTTQTPEKASSEEGENNGNNFLFAFNVTPIGVNVGKRFFGMAEINIGYDSWFKVGLGCRW